MSTNSKPNDSRKQDSKDFLKVIGFSKAEFIFWILYLITFAGLGYYLSQNGLPQTGLWICIAAAAILVIWVFGIFWFMGKKKKAVKVMANVLLGLVGAVAMFSVFVYTATPSMMFYPHFDEASYLELLEKEDTEELSFEAEDGGISGWFWHNAQEGAPTLIYFGGNGENASTRLVRILKDEKMTGIFEGYQVAILDYPGYGLTSGVPSEESLKKFGLAAYDAIAAREDVEDILIMGYSIGTGVANYVASEREVKGLILMAPYADGYDLYNSFMNVFYGPMRMLVAFKMESIQYASSIEIKPLILASKADEMIPFASSERLSEAFPKGCETVWFTDIRHNDFWGEKQMVNELEEYLKEHI